MPLSTDLYRISAILDRDRSWSAYAIGDLSPGLVEHCEWHASTDQSALVLLYRGFDPPIAFAIGDPRYLPALFSEITVPAISLHVRPEVVDAISDLYMPTHRQEMLRMALHPAAFRPASVQGVTPVGEDDLEAVSALYEDGFRVGEGPTFFHPAMLRQESFRGVWEDGRLISIAGTHLFSPDLGVCTIGNIYTRRDRRGRGLAARVTSAVVAHAIDKQVPTIVLNVAQTNETARRVYERLGFAIYCEFVEGDARRVD